MTVEDFKLATARDVAPPTGQPIVGVDLGQNRSWSAAVAIWETGRIEAMAVTPGIPDIQAQEKRDTVPKGTYQKLCDMEVLDVADDLRVVPPSQLWENIKDRWGTPAAMVCDRFRFDDLQDAVQNACYIDPRVSRYSEAASDVRDLRKAFKDGPFSVEESSRPLLIASLAAAHVTNDDQGNTRLSKRTKDQKARDDVAAALTLAAGGWGRATLGRRGGTRRRDGGFHSEMSRHHAEIGQAAWEGIRQKAFAEQGRRCGKCGKAGALEVHHVKELAPRWDERSEQPAGTLSRGSHRHPPASARGRVAGLASYVEGDSMKVIGFNVREGLPHGKPATGFQWIPALDGHRHRSRSTKSAICLPTEKRRLSKLGKWHTPRGGVTRPLIMVESQAWQVMSREIRG